MTARNTLTFEPDVLALLERARKQKKASLKAVVNAALREGLPRILEPEKPKKAYRTKSMDLGECYYPNLDNVWEVIAEVEGEDHR